VNVVILSDGLLHSKGEGMKPTRKKWPKLAKYWDDYGHSINFDDLFDLKATDHYAVVAWMEDGMVNYADLSRIDDGYEMNNDGHELISLKSWKGARIKPECDWMIIDGKDPWA
jgi:hypothetical protein